MYGFLVVLHFSFLIASSPLKNRLPQCKYHHVIFLYFNKITKKDNACFLNKKKERKIDYQALNSYYQYCSCHIVN